MQKVIAEIPKVRVLYKGEFENCKVVVEWNEKFVKPKFWVRLLDKDGNRINGLIRPYMTKRTAIKHAKNFADRKYGIA